MKSIQMIIYGFFHYQKTLLGREIENKYNRNKKLAIEYTNKLLKDRVKKDYEELYQFFNNNKKKDELADVFLQGLYYLDKIQ